MISGAGLAAGAFAGEKSDFTDQEGSERRASRSSRGLAVEESVRIAGVLAIEIGWNLLVRMVRSRGLGIIIAQASIVRDARCKVKCPSSTELKEDTSQTVTQSRFCDLRALSIVAKGGESAFALSSTFFQSLPIGCSSPTSNSTISPLLSSFLQLSSISAIRIYLCGCSMFPSHRQ